jgi:hypothetical protein
VNVRIGITGHSNISPEAVPIIAEEIRRRLAEYSEPIVGVTCLARGADQVFARVVLDIGGEVEVVLPAADYRERKVKQENRTEFETLIGKAARVQVLPFETSNRDAYMAASETVLSGVDVLVAVWDGEPSGGHGGTGEVVEAARRLGLPVTVVWPDGATRSP